MQSLPSGKPDLLQFSLAKLDVSALERDIPKYQYQMPETQFNTWKQWVAMAKSATAPDEYDWAIDTLKLTARSEPVQPAEQLAEELLELRDRETQPTREVSNLNDYDTHMFSIYYTKNTYQSDLNVHTIK